ncbi:flagellar biosynthesis anti-sigma factor FlgM [Sphingosinicellaceae bacterium]|nr:flagellar biosynthesis anti-sigma factor FlgM [Sphingosinicellaceae bacterium]
MTVPVVTNTSRLAALEAVAAARTQPQRSEAVQRPAEPARASEPLNLSGTAVAARALAASPPVDGAKVVRLRAAIADGIYKPDPEAIAGKMIALDLPGA